MAWILYLILAVVLLAGLYINLVGAPGIWLMVAATIGYGALTHWSYSGWKTIAVIVALAGIAELFEFVAAGAAAKKAGASRRGIIGAMLGGIAGAIFFSIPLPIIGTILGICIGTFLGAIVGELTFGNEVGGSLRVGMGAVRGRLIGTLIKLLFGCMVLCIVLMADIPVHLFAAKAPVAPKPPVITTMPSTRK